MKSNTFLTLILRTKNKRTNKKDMRLTLLTLLTVIGTAIFAQEARVMTLQECVELATENNLNVQRSKLNLESAEADLKQANFSRLPNLNASGGYRINWGRSIDPTSNAFVTERINSFGVNGNSSVTLFNAFNVTNSLKSTEKELEASEFDVEKSSNDVQLNVVTFYLNVIFNKELLENARFQLQSSENQLERTKKLVEEGALPRTSELDLASQVATNQVNVINAENNLNFALLTLKQVMLLPAEENIDVTAPDVDIEEVDLGVSTSQVFTSAEQSLPEIKAADLRVMSSEFNYKAAQAQVYPTISLSGGLSSNYSSFAKPFDPTLDGTEWEFGEQLSDNLSEFVTLGVNIPIFNGLSAQAGKQRSKIFMQQAQINAQEQRNFLRQTIETAYNDAQAAQKTFDAATRQVAALEETFRSVENQLALGAANQTDFQVAQNNLFGAKSDLTRAKFDYIFKKKLLDFYQGKPIF